MIERYAADHGASEARLVVQPQRALNSRQIAVAFALIALPSMVVSVSSWAQGNRFAPWYSALTLLGLGAAMLRIMRQGRQAEVIAVTPERLAVHRIPSLEEAFTAPVPWVRVDAVAGRLALSSAGRRVEIGTFLGDWERARLAHQLSVLLRWARRSNRSGRGSDRR